MFPVRLTSSITDENSANIVDDDKGGTAGADSDRNIAERELPVGRTRPKQVIPRRQVETLNPVDPFRSSLLPKFDSLVRDLREQGL
jgi:hypothetical protein